MITLFTGLPGHGKTLYALCYIKAFAEKHGRPVFYSGIRDVTIPGWTLFGDSGDNADKPWETDASKWYELPDGAIIVIDEAQRLFRPRGTGSVVPAYVSNLETHRHRGFDIFVITQHPMLMDSNVRRLVGQHFHSVRLLGMHKATIHEYPSCTEVTKSSFEDSVKHQFSYPKEAFGWYKSAEVHTHKRRIPMRVWFMLMAPVLVIGLLWFGYSRVAKFWEKKPEADPAIAAATAKASPAAKGGPVSELEGLEGHLSQEAYLLAHRPRLAGLPHTAPTYDAVTTPTRAPVPVACGAMKSRGCRCYSQDGTRIGMEEQLCQSIVANGYFAGFDPGPALGVKVSGPSDAASVTGTGAPGGVVPTSGPGQLPSASAPPTPAPAPHTGRVATATRPVPVQPQRLPVLPRVQKPRG